ncbi:MAG: protein-glutamate O-methyltransferase [Erythrobacter sp. 34-65-8]|nr:MAG: protein-glutamate O-methyltransferase [Erythrobacter sp. 34-65-8]
MSGFSASHSVVADLLRARTGQQLTEGRRWRIDTALAGLFREQGISNVDQLACLLAESGADILARDVVEALLNNETYFFRDRPMFEMLAGKVLPDLAARRAGARRLRIWSAGCSTGQEAYTTAILFAQEPERWRGWSVEIVGTDVSGRAVAAAHHACYSQFEIQRGLSVGQMLGWFHETPNGWAPNDALRAMVRFERRNILDPFDHARPFDLVLCRNVLLYFDGPTRERAFARLDQALAEDGWLMLGAGETVVGRTGIFEPVEGNQGLCRRKSASNAPVRQARASIR